MKHVDHFLSRLSGVAKSGHGWKALCPCPKHSDRNPSLSINLSNDDQRILVHCFGGCPTDTVLDELGLDSTDLRPIPGDTTDEEVVSPKITTSDPALCNEIYLTLLSKLTLTKEHREQLRKRGLTDAQIDRNGYRSLSFFKFRQTVPSLRDEFDERLLTVPGFTTDDGEIKPIQMPNGILIPIRDVQGRIVALQIRSDKGDPKYLWFSGGDTSCGSPTHVPLGIKTATEVRVTEGPLKADVAFALDGESTIGVAGVSSWSSALPVLEAIGAKTVRLAFDADASEKQGVANALTDCCNALKDRYEIQLEVWSADQGKGIDDLLLKGGKPEILTGKHVDEYLEKLNTLEPTEEASRPEAEMPAVPEPAAVTPESPAASKGPDKFPYGDGDPVPFPIDFFPPQLQEVVREISTAVNCPPDLTACAMVSAAATAIGRSRQMEPKEDWRISPRLYMCLVCEPGSGKTPALTKIMLPLWQKNHEWKEEYDEQMEIFETEKLAFDTLKKEFVKRVVTRSKQDQGYRGEVQIEDTDDSDAFDELNPEN